MTERIPTTMTQAQALDEAVLLMVRKLMRLDPDVHSLVWSKLPAGAREALTASEVRADVFRDYHAPVWPETPSGE